MMCFVSCEVASWCTRPLLPKQWASWGKQPLLWSVHQLRIVGLGCTLYHQQLLVTQRGKLNGGSVGTERQRKKERPRERERESNRELSWQARYDEEVVCWKLFTAMRNVCEVQKQRKRKWTRGSVKKKGAKESRSTGKGHTNPAGSDLRTAKAWRWSK